MPLQLDSVFLHKAQSLIGHPPTAAPPHSKRRSTFSPTAHSVPSSPAAIACPDPTTPRAPLGYVPDETFEMRHHAIPIANRSRTNADPDQRCVTPNKLRLKILNPSLSQNCRKKQVPRPGSAYPCIARFVTLAVNSCSLSYPSIRTIAGWQPGNAHPSWSEKFLQCRCQKWNDTCDPPVATPRCVSQFLRPPRHMPIKTRVRRLQCQCAPIHRIQQLIECPSRFPQFIPTARLGQWPNRHRPVRNPAHVPGHMPNRPAHQPEAAK